MSAMESGMGYASNNTMLLMTRRNKKEMEMMELMHEE
jgi:hypothetical protein